MILSIQPSYLSRQRRATRKKRRSTKNNYNNNNDAAFGSFKDSFRSTSVTDHRLNQNGNVDGEKSLTNSASDDDENNVYYSGSNINKRPARNAADNYSWKDPSSWLFNWGTGGLYDAGANDSDFDADYLLDDEEVEDPQVGFWSDFKVRSYSKSAWECIWKS